MATVHTASSGVHEGRSASVGQLLKGARERRGLTIQEIAKETKLPQRHLEALEQDNLAALPTAFYQRAEVRAYAQAVGLDQKDLLTRLDSALRPQQAGGTLREARSPQTPARTRAYALMALGLVAAMALVYAIRERAQTPATATRQPEHTQPAASPPAPATQGTVPAGTVPTSIETTDAVKASDVAVPPSTEPAEAPPPPGAVTELVVTSQPPGARVTVNGIAWGLTPVAIHHLPPGDKQIRVTMEGYAAQERVLRLDQGRQRAVDISLESVP